MSEQVPRMTPSTEPSADQIDVEVAVSPVIDENEPVITSENGEINQHEGDMQLAEPDLGSPVIIESPDSIPNNYAVHDKDGLIVARSRTNNSKSLQELNDEEFMDSIHEKQRGFVEHDIKLAGKPFVLVKRGKSKRPGEETDLTSKPIEGDEPSGGDTGAEDLPDVDDQSSEFDQVIDEDPQAAEQGAKDTERVPRDHRFHAKGKQVAWGPDENGMVQKGLEFRGQKMHKVRGADGRIHMMPEVISWDKVPYMQGANREVILRAFDRGSNTSYTAFIKGDKMYEIVSENQGEPQMRMIDLDGAEMPDIAIGHPLAWNNNRGLELYSVQVKSPDEKAPAYRQFKGKELNESYESEIEKVHSQIDKLVDQKAKVMGVDRSEIDRSQAGLELTQNGVMRSKSVADQEGQRLFTKTHQGLRGVSPFEEIEAKINGTSPTQSGEKLEDIVDDEPPTMELPSTETETEQRRNLEEEMADVSKRFDDKTYVPTPEEYSQMRELASRVRIDYGDEDGKRPIRYLNVDGGQLNAVATRQFLDRISRGKWSLKDSEAAYAEDMHESATPLNIERLDTLQVPDRANLPWLRFGEFSKEVRKKSKVGLGQKDLVNQYKSYLARRIELSDMLTNRQNAAEEYGDHVPEVITPDDMIIGGLRNFSRGINEERQRRRREAVDRLKNVRPDRVARRAARRIRRGRN